MKRDTKNEISTINSAYRLQMKRKLEARRNSEERRSKGPGWSHGGAFASMGEPKPYPAPLPGQPPKGAEYWQDNEAG